MATEGSLQIQNILPLLLILRQINPIHIPSYGFFKNHSNAHPIYE